MMRRLVWVAVPALAAALWLSCGRSAGTSWPGVDEAVVERVAEEAGRGSSGPIFEALQGDLLLFAFLWAGLLAGFALGYLSRVLFVERLDAPAPAPIDEAECHVD